MPGKLTLDGREGTKRCSACRESKRLTEFYRRGFSPQGEQRFEGRCIPCFRSHHGKDVAPQRSALRIAARVANGERLCSLCQTVKPVTEFHRSKTKASGSMSWCRPCVSAKQGVARRKWLARSPNENAALRAQGLKWCPTCGTPRPLSHFGVAKRRPDGLQGQCRACMRRADKRSYRKDLEASRAASRAAAKRDPRVRERQLRIYREHPERRAAHTAVFNAVRSGRLIRPEHCSRCGKRDRIEGHHDDYSKKLDVMWLCTACHRERHAELAARGADPDFSERPEPARAAPVSSVGRAAG